MPLPSTEGCRPGMGWTPSGPPSEPNELTGRFPPCLPATFVRRRWFVWSFNPVHAASTSLTYKSKTEVAIWLFDLIYTAATSFTCNGERELGFYGLSSLFTSPPPPSWERARQRYIYCFEPVCTPTTSFTCNSKTEVDFYVISTPFAPLLLP